MIPSIILSQTDKLLSFCKLLIVAIKPKKTTTAANCSLAVMAATCGVRVTDSGRRRRVAWLESQCLSQIWIMRKATIHYKSHQKFDCWQHFRCKQTKSLCTSHCETFVEMWHEATFAFVVQWVGHLSRNGEVAGSDPIVWSLHIVTMRKFLLVCAMGHIKLKSAGFVKCGNDIRYVFTKAAIKLLGNWSLISFGFIILSESHINS